MKTKNKVLMRLFVYFVFLQVPLMLRRLYELSKSYLEPQSSSCDIPKISFGVYPENVMEDESCNLVLEDCNKSHRKSSKIKKVNLYIICTDHTVFVFH